MNAFIRQRATAAALGAITLIGAVLRLAGLARLPPGQYLDESRVSLIARDAAATGHFQLYYSPAGYHPAIVLVAALWRWLTANSPLALRDGVAVLSVLSLPLIFFALRAIFELDEPGPRATALALLGTLITAITLSHIIISRTGAEMTLTIPFAALAFLFLALGLRVGRRRYFVLAGVALGLSLYTYFSARLLPVAIAAAMGWIALRDGRAAWRARAIELAIVASAALLVVLPFAYYFVTHPDDFVLRALATSSQLRRGGPGDLLNGTLRTLGGLVLPGFGDIIPRHNLPGRPLFDAFVGLCLVLGAVLAAAGLRQRSRALLASWAALLLVPTILTMENNSPHFTRQIAATPALAGLAALGVVMICDVLNKRSRWLAAGLVTVGLLFSLAATSEVLFVRWAGSPDLYEAFLVGDWRAANLALDRSQTQDVYLSPELISDSQHDSFDLLLRASPVRDFPGPGCLLYRDQPDRPLTYIVFAPADPRTAVRIAALFPQSSQAAPILHQPNPYPDYRIFQVPAGATATAPQHVTNAVFGGALRLLGYDLSATTVRAGETLTVTLYWQALQSPLPDYSMFVHMYLPGGDAGAAGVSPQPAAQNDGAPCGQSFPTPRWQTGEIVVDERALTVPADFQFGSAALGLGVYGWPSLERLPVAGPVPLLTGDRVRLGEIKVVP